MGTKHIIWEISYLDPSFGKDILISFEYLRNLKMDSEVKLTF